VELVEALAVAVLGRVLVAGAQLGDAQVEPEGGEAVVLLDGVAAQLDRALEVAVEEGEEPGGGDGLEVAVAAEGQGPLDVGERLLERLGRGHGAEGGLTDLVGPGVEVGGSPPGEGGSEVGAVL